MDPVALVPAAGRSMRMYPLKEKKPRALLDIEGKPLLQYTVEILRDQLHAKEMYLVIGEHDEQIKDYFQDGSHLEVDLNYIVQEKCKGIGHAVGLGEEYIDRPFFVILGDEMYINTNHKEMLSLLEKDFNVICAFKRDINKNMIKKNYTAEIEGNKILSLTEKPQSPTTGLLGVGTYVFDPIVFRYIKKAQPSPLRNEIEITDVINTIARTESGVYAFFLEGYYANINTLKDLNLATYEWRSSHFDEYSISVIIPAYNEEESIGVVMKDFDKGYEVVVADNNSTDRTAHIAEELKVKLVFEPLKGYGNALKCGLTNAKGDILIITEADASFKSKDLPKILEYLKECDLVVGTRTHRQFIDEGAHMDWFLRWGNVVLGKLVEVLWWGKGARFTDVGCTYRGVWKTAYERVKDRLESGGASFSVEMMIEMMKADMRVIEIPVGYYERYGGKSEHSAGRIQNIRTGLEMLSVIGKKRVK